MKQYFLVIVTLGLINLAISELSTGEKGNLKDAANQLRLKIIRAEGNPEEIYANAKEFQRIYKDLGHEVDDYLHVTKKKAFKITRLYDLSSKPCKLEDNDWSFNTRILDRYTSIYDEYEAYCFEKYYKNCEKNLDDKLKIKIEELSDDNLDYSSILEEVYLKPNKKSGIFNKGEPLLSEDDFGRGVVSIELKDGLTRKKLEELAKPRDIREFLVEIMKDIKGQCGEILGKFQPLTRMYQNLDKRIKITESNFNHTSEWVPKINLCSHIGEICTLGSDEKEYRGCLRSAFQTFNKLVDRSDILVKYDHSQ